MPSYQRFIMDIEPKFDKSTKTIDRALNKQNPVNYPKYNGKSTNALVGVNWDGIDGETNKNAQNALIELNREWMCTNEQLASILRYLFPNRPMADMAGFAAHHIPGMRRDYVNWKHGKNWPIPKPGIYEYKISGSMDGAREIKRKTVPAVKTQTVKKLAK